MYTYHIIYIYIICFLCCTPLPALPALSVELELYIFLVPIHLSALYTDIKGEEGETGPGARTEESKNKIGS